MFFFFSSRRRHTRSLRDWSSDVCSSDLAKRAASIVRDLILFAEHRPPRRQRCQIAEQIKQVLAFEQARLEADGIRVRTDIEPAPEIWADANHVQEVLLHVVQNAQHAMKAA